MPCNDASQDAEKVPYMDSAAPESRATWTRAENLIRRRQAIKIVRLQSARKNTKIALYEKSH